jgi:hypothetical protein
MCSSWDFFWYISSIVLLFFFVGSEAAGTALLSVFTFLGASGIGEVGSRSSSSKP